MKISSGRAFSSFSDTFPCRGWNHRRRQLAHSLRRKKWSIAWTCWLNCSVITPFLSLGHREQRLPSVLLHWQLPADQFCFPTPTPEHWQSSHLQEGPGHAETERDYLGQSTIMHERCPWEQHQGATQFVEFSVLRLSEMWVAGSNTNVKLTSSSDLDSESLSWSAQSTRKTTPFTAGR